MRCRLRGRPFRPAVGGGGARLGAGAACRATDGGRGHPDPGDGGELRRADGPPHRCHDERLGQHPRPGRHLHVGGVAALRCQWRQHVARVGLERPRGDPAMAPRCPSHGSRVRELRGGSSTVGSAMGGRHGAHAAAAPWRWGGGGQQHAGPRRPSTSSCPPMPPPWSLWPAFIQVRSPRAGRRWHTHLGVRVAPSVAGAAVLGVGAGTYHFQGVASRA